MKNIGQIAVKSRVRLVMALDVSRQIEYMMTHAKLEWQWFHCVDRMVADGDTIDYVLSELFIPEQECQAAEVESGPMMQMKLYNEIKAQCGDDAEKIKRTVSRLGAWCHSHVNMAVKPSETDFEQFQQDIELDTTGGRTGPRIMIILNKRGEIYSRIFDPELGLEFEHVPLVVDMPDIDLTMCKDALVNKLKEKKAPPKEIPPTPTAGYQSSTGFQHWKSANQGAPNPPGKAVAGSSTTKKGGSALSATGTHGSNAHGTTVQKKTAGNGTSTATAGQSSAKGKGSRGKGFAVIGAGGSKSITGDRDIELIELVSTANTASRPADTVDKIMNSLLDHLPQEYMELFYQMLYGNDTEVRDALRNIWMDGDADPEREWTIKLHDALMRQTINPPALICLAESVYLDITYDDAGWGAAMKQLNNFLICREQYEEVAFMGDERQANDLIKQAMRLT